jgi:hypothetical protein
MKTQTKLKKYNLAGIKRAGERSALSTDGDFTCILLERECDKLNTYHHEDLHSDIFEISARQHSTFGGIIEEIYGERPNTEDLKSFRLMALAMTYEIARRMNTGDNILEITQD